MAYRGINKARFRYLLSHGVGDDELRRFFNETHKRLIIKGAKVQNLPRGPKARVVAMLNLPSSTDNIVQEWFSNNLTMIDPEAFEDLIETFQIYEASEEGPPAQEAERLSRACLVHLFSPQPAKSLVQFLQSPIGGAEEVGEDESDSGAEPMSQACEPTLAVADLARALVALLRGKDPDNHLTHLPSALASIIAALHEIKGSQDEDLEEMLVEMDEREEIKAILGDYAKWLEEKGAEKSERPAGIQLIRLEELENPEFDLDHDQIIAKCTTDASDRAVFVQPFAIATRQGNLVSIERQAARERLFPHSGDVQAFVGQGLPKQPRRGEIGMWRVAPNEPHGTLTHRTNFHLSGGKTDLYEVRLVPFRSTEYDSVRGFIMEQMSRSDKKQFEPLLFVLSDDLIVGSPSGKNLTKEEDFDAALPCWSALTAFRFEGRLFVLGPLPAHEQYECGTLASTLKKIVARRSGVVELTKAQIRTIIDSVNSGEPHLNASRRKRLLDELKYLESDELAVEILLDEAMSREKIKEKLECRVQERVDEQTGEKSELSKEIDSLKRQLLEIRESIAREQKQQKSIPAKVAKAVRDSLTKAKEDMFGTLGQVLLFQALMDHQESSQAVISGSSGALDAKNIIVAEHEEKKLLGVLKALGLSAKHALALQMVGEVVFGAGMILVIDGVGARLAAEAWGRSNEMGCVLIDCTIGLTEDGQLRELIGNESRALVILDANFSLVDVYARPLIERVQRRMIGQEYSTNPKIVMSLSDSVASLPLPNVVRALAVRVSLERKPEYLPGDEVMAKISELDEEESAPEWAGHLWKPAARALFRGLREISSENAALVLAVLEAQQLDVQ